MLFHDSVASAERIDKMELLQALPKGPVARPLLASSGGDFILTRRRVGHTLGLTSTDTPGEVTMYGESVGAEVWCEGVVCHAALMVLEVRLTHYLVGSTSDVVVATGLAYI
ncbi:hypothetical protein B296_00015443 [Ensete ventricosum]|uniref:Uncharacterized protein n=1 Tax=Ensete ventricosum TaxID=4639 RepID=A0A427B3S3_ENSVE|nr:hypothetical protein B296_00015443 [Ensete ventricosum]